LHDAFIDGLRDIYDAERKLVKALGQLFAALGEPVRGKHCEGIAGIIQEGKAIMEEDFD